MSRNPTPFRGEESSLRIDSLMESECNGLMNLTLQIPLVPDADQDEALRQTAERLNEAANWVDRGTVALRGRSSPTAVYEPAVDAIVSG